MMQVNPDPVFFITGCASGIGQHLAQVMLARGHRVCATDINLDALKNHAKEAGWPLDRVSLRRLDVRDAEDWQAAFDEAVARFGSVDVLMNVAGFLRPAWVAKMTAEDVHRHFDINTKGDRLASITYPSGGLVSYTRDVLGRISGVTWKASANATAVTLVSNATYYPFGPLNALTYGDGHTLTKTYDEDYAIENIASSYVEGLNAAQLMTDRKAECFLPHYLVRRSPV